MRVLALYLISLSLLFCAPAFSQNAIPHDVVGCGGGESSGGGYFLHDTIGQPTIGLTAATGNTNKVGYWYVVDQMHIGPTSEVLVTSFEATLTDEGVVLNWHLGRADNLRGFNVYRSSEKDGGYERLNDALIPYSGKGGYLDNNITPATTYWYRVGFLDKDGEFFSPSEKVFVPLRETTLYQNYPNPFNPTTTISFFVPGSKRVELMIFDAQGRRIRSLVNNTYTYGRHKIEWNGLNDRGEQVSSGVYFYRMKAGKKVLTRKLTLLK